MSPYAHLTEFLQQLPHLPGVYRMIDEKGKVLYVGKAKNLSSRVKSYFRTKNHSPRIQLMVKQVAKIEITITRSEAEALILENSLIKSLKPKYNILFRDDKSYPFIKISAHHFPQISYYRGNLHKPNQYFGPYPNAYFIRENIQIIQKVFQLRTCQDSVFNHRNRPCLLYQIKRCSAPCVGKISQETYQQNVHEAILFLNGKTDVLIKTLTTKMEKAAEELNFEIAAKYRDQILSLNNAQQNQFINSQYEKINIDILSCVEDQGLICIHWISIRQGKYVGDKSFIPEHSENIDYSILNCTESFLSQHYLGRMKPDEILTDFPVSAIIQEALISENQKNIDFLYKNVIGERKKWLNMAQQNALLAIKRESSFNKNQYQRVSELQLLLDIPKINRIECFDISHTFGEATIASCVVYENFAMQHTQYRRFNITDIQAGDDYAAMEQALTRRYKRLSDEVREGTSRFPDLVLIDGGKGQISTALKVWDKLQLSIPLVGVAKGPERKPGLEDLIIPFQNRVVHLSPDSPALHLIQTVRDESHRFAITGHRKKRDQNRQKSKLDEIPSIGSKRKKALLIRFGGLKEIEAAGIEELMQVTGISKKIAENIYLHLHH